MQNRPPNKQHWMTISNQSNLKCISRIRLKANPLCRLRMYLDKKECTWENCLIKRDSDPAPVNDHQSTVTKTKDAKA